MTISFEEKVYGITGEELDQILSAEYTTIESERDEVPSFLDSLTVLEAELAGGIDRYGEEQISVSAEGQMIDFSAFTYGAHNFGGDAAQSASLISNNYFWRNR